MLQVPLPVEEGSFLREPDVRSNHTSIGDLAREILNFEAREGTQELGTKPNTRLTFYPGFVLPGIQRGTPPLSQAG